MQWRPFWVPFPQRTSNPSGLLLAFLILLMSACSSGGVQSTPVPTLTLIPSTPTFTPLPPTETATRISSIRPEALATSVPRYLASLDDADQRRIANFAALDLLDQTQANPLVLQLLVFEDWNSNNWVCLEDSEVRGGYRVVYQLQNEIFDYHVSDSESIILCQRANIRQIDAGLRLLIDPVAADLVNLAQRRVGREADVPEEDVLVDEIVPRTWPDSSLGCPVAGNTYIEQNIDGYFIRLLVDERWYQFHTDFERAILCASGNLNAALPDDATDPEETPEATSEANPEATDEIEIDA